jgi:hypothetical protein
MESKVALPIPQTGLMNLCSLGQAPVEVSGCIYLQIYN